MRAIAGVRITQKAEVRLVVNVYHTYTLILTITKNNYEIFPGVTARFKPILFTTTWNNPDLSA